MSILTGTGVRVLFETEKIAQSIGISYTSDQAAPDVYFSILVWGPIRTFSNAARNGLWAFASIDSPSDSLVPKAAG